MSVVLVTAVWPATGSKFMQAFESKDAAMAKYRDLKEDSGAKVSLIKTPFKSIDEIGMLLMSYDEKSQGQRQ